MLSVKWFLAALCAAIAHGHQHYFTPETGGLHVADLVRCERPLSGSESLTDRYLG